MLRYIHTLGSRVGTNLLVISECVHMFDRLSVVQLAAALTLKM